MVRSLDSCLISSAMVCWPEDSGGRGNAGNPNDLFQPPVVPFLSSESVI